MVYLSLQQKSFREIQMKINIKERPQIEVETNYSFSVEYGQDNSSCIAHLRQNVRSKEDSSIFSIVVECSGNFSCEGITDDDDKKIAHIQSYILLFPYVQDMIATLTASAGLAPMMIKMDKMEPENVEVKKI